MLITRFPIAALGAIAIVAWGAPVLAGDTARNEDRIESAAYYGKTVARPVASSTAAAKTSGSVNGFESAGGEAGWQLAQHKFERRGGRFEHAAECDHAIRTVAAPTPAELEKVRQLYPGG